MTDLTAEDPWRVGTLDLAGYLARLGVAPRPPGREALDELLEAHVRAFTFDNVDVLLEQHPGVRLDQVAGKFVGRGRGGYCFEHATLFAAALQRLGYEVRRMLGRVGDATRAGRTHMVVAVTLDGERLLADPGFGMSILRPMRLADGAEDDHRGWRYRVLRHDTSAGPAWQLHRLRDAGWELMHTTDELPVHPVDVMMGHHFTSTFPASHFRSGLMVARHGDGRHTTVTHETVTVRRPERATEHRPLAAGELPRLLRELGAGLADDEEQRLLALVPTMAATG